MMKQRIFLGIKDLILIINICGLNLNSSSLDQIFSFSNSIELNLINCNENKKKP